MNNAIGKTTRRSLLDPSSASPTGMPESVDPPSVTNQAVVAGDAVLAGATATWYFNLTFDTSGDVGYLEAWFTNSAASSVAVDLMIVCAIFLVVESQRLSMRYSSLHLAGIPFIAIAFSFPLFLARRHVAIVWGRS